MALMRMQDGSVYDVPDNEVEVAMSQYGAVPADQAGPSPAASGNVLFKTPWGAEIPKPGLGELGLGVGGAALMKAAFAVPRMSRSLSREPAWYGAATRMFREGALGEGRGRAPGPVGPQEGPAGLVKLTEEDILRYPELREYKPGENITRSELQSIKRPKPPPPEPKIPPPPKLPTNLVELTPDDIARHPEFKNFEPGQTVSRKTYEAVKIPPRLPLKPPAEAPRLAAPVAAKPDVVAPAAPVEQRGWEGRHVYGEGKKSLTKYGDVDDVERSFGPKSAQARAARKIAARVAPDAPAPAAPAAAPAAAAPAAPAPAAAAKPSQQKKLSGPEWERRSKKFSPKLKEAIAGAESEQLSTALSKSEKILKIAKEHNLTPEQRGTLVKLVRQGYEPEQIMANARSFAGKATGALGIALMLLDASQVDEQIEGAQGEIRNIQIKAAKTPSERRAREQAAEPRGL